MTGCVWVQLLSTTLFFGVLGGGAFLLFKTQTAGKGEAVKEAESESNDVLENAKRLMDKYK